MGSFDISWLWKATFVVTTIVVSLFAAAADSVSMVGSAGFTAFALTGFGLMWRSWRRELNRLAFNLSKKDRQIIILLNACTRNGLGIPEEYYIVGRAEKVEDLDE